MLRVLHFRAWLVCDDVVWEIPVNAHIVHVCLQDWLFNEFAQYVGAMTQNVTLARQWLLQMGAGAARNGLTIQYCMPYVRHLLQSLEVPVVTQARASDDYVVGPPPPQSPLQQPPPDQTTTHSFSNWKIGGQSLLLDALGLAPSKDGFWSTPIQPGNPYGDERGERCPRLQSAVTTLSAGPVAIGDGLGFSDPILILRACMADGRLLQPSHPATPIDVTMLAAAFEDVTVGPIGQVWFAPSHVGGQLAAGYLLAIELAVSLLFFFFTHFSNFFRNPASLVMVVV
jgi:hypothetical protein